MKTSKGWWKKLIKAIGPFLLIFFLIKIVDPLAVADRLKEINIGIFLASILFFPLVILLRSFRWWLFCRHLHLGASFRSLLPIYSISRFLSILPITGVFTVSRIMYLKHEGKAAGTTALSVILDKFFDIIGLLFFGLFAVFYFPQNLIGGSSIWIIYGAIILFIGMVIAFGKKIGNGLLAFSKRHMNQKIRKMGANMEADLTRFWSEINLKLILLLLAIAIAIGILRSLALYVLALSINIHVPFTMMIGCRALIGIVNIIPVSVGGLGTRDAVLLLTLPLSGVSHDAALALGFLAFLWNILLKFSGVIFWIKRPLPIEAFLDFKERLFK